MIRDNASMPRILIVKTSSLGDVVHALPAVTDLAAMRPDCVVDWLVEAAFADIPRLHPQVSEVIPCALRKWRKAPRAPETRAAYAAMRAHLRARPYDCIVDLQGLLKSAWLARIARGPRVGYSWSSAREPLASLSYDRKVAVSRSLHAVTRNRSLLAGALRYELPLGQNYGVLLQNHRQKMVVCVHGTSRDSKLWPEAHWRALIRAFGERGYVCELPWGNDAEFARTERLAEGLANAVVRPRLSIAEMAPLLARATCVVGVDTGFVHLACAVGTPTVAIYTATEPGLSGAWAGQSSAVNLGGAGQCPRPEDVLAACTPVLGTDAS